MPPTAKPEAAYQHQEYPKMLYKKAKDDTVKSMTAISPEHEEVAVKAGWGGHPDSVEEGETVDPGVAEDPDAPPAPPGEEKAAKAAKPPKPGKK